MAGFDGKRSGRFRERRSCWFDGSDLVGIEHWGFRRPKWIMKNKPKDWQPLPEVYRLAREAKKQAAVDLARARSNERFLQATARRQSAGAASPV